MLFEAQLGDTQLIGSQISGTPLPGNTLVKRLSEVHTCTHCCMQISKSSKDGGALEAAGTSHSQISTKDGRVIRDGYMVPSASKTGVP